MTRRAHEERGKKLAAQLLEALDAPEDPARRRADWGTQRPLPDYDLLAV